MQNTSDNLRCEERQLAAHSGYGMLIGNSLLLLAAMAAFVWGAVLLEDSRPAFGAVLMCLGGIYAFFVGPVFYIGLKIVRPGEAAVFTKFGRYIGTIKEAGFYYLSPFAVAMTVPGPGATTGAVLLEQSVATQKNGEQAMKVAVPKKRLSLKAMTLSNDKQKINDSLGNPIIIGIVVIWRVVDTAKAMFSVDNYVEFLSVQCDSALRNTVRLYPYDACDSEEAGEKSLRGSSQEIAANLRDEIQQKVEVAGLEILEARITHLAYAPEIAAAMLQRQQAAAIVDARQLIVEGAVGMVEMALERLSQRSVVELDEERKAAMVSNLMVVLCGNRDAQPVVNSGSLY